MDKLENVTVVRSKWSGIREPGKLWLTGLASEDDKHCCLGFACLEAGVPKSQMAGFAMPQTTYNYEKQVPFFTNSDTELVETHPQYLKAWVIDAARINDHKTMPIHQKEQALIELFKEQGITLTFVD